MERKPIQILLVAFVQLFNPFANVFINSWQFGLPPSAIVNSVMAAPSWITPFEFFMIGPISAVAIFSVKRWSYPVFLLCSAVTIGSNLMTWVRYPNAISLGLLLTLCALNIALVTYFVLPQVRMPYFEPKIRWWEAAPRWHQPLLTTYGVGNNKIMGRTLNFSEGGAFIEVEGAMEPGTQLTLQFELQGHVYRFEGKVVYFRREGVRGCGVEFNHTPETKKHAASVVKYLRRAGATRQPAPRNLFTEVTNLVVSLVRGKGWVPEISAAAKAKAQKPVQVEEKKSKAA